MTTSAAQREGATVQVTAGFADAERPKIARLCWQAFGGKLGRVLGPAPRAEAYLARAIRPDHALVARDAAGRLLGVAGFRTARGSFLGPDRAAMAAVYGRAGAALRAGLMALLTSDTDNHRFLVDGICVAAPARGRGVGSALIAALVAEAGRRGHAELRLDVAAGNARARALYQRTGFAVTGTSRSRLSGLLFDLPGWVTMVRPV